MTMDARYLAKLTSSFKRLALSVEWTYRGSPWQEVPINSGSVTQDRNADCRWAAALELPAPYRVDIKNGINPYGALFRIRRGIRPVRGSDVMSNWGIYRVEEATENKITGGLQLQLFSREKQIIDARFLKPRAFLGTMESIISTLVLEATPDVSISWDPQLNKFKGIAQNFTAARDRWGTLESGVDGKSLTKSMGAEAFFMGNGLFRLQPVPGINDAIVWEVDEERFNAVLTADETYTRDSVFNVVAAFSTAPRKKKTDPPVGFTEYAWDDEPSSPTYAGPNPITAPQLSTPEVAPFGIVPRFYASPFLRTYDQAKAVARMYKNQSLGLQRTFNFTANLNPELKAGDVVKLFGNRYLVESIDADLLGSTMTVNTRSSKNDLEDVEVSDT